MRIAAAIWRPQSPTAQWPLTGHVTPTAPGQSLDRGARSACIRPLHSLAFTRDEAVGSRGDRTAPSRPAATAFTPCVRLRSPPADPPAQNLQDGEREPPLDLGGLFSANVWHTNRPERSNRTHPSQPHLAAPSRPLPRSTPHKSCIFEPNASRTEPKRKCSPASHRPPTTTTRRLTPTNRVQETGHRSPAGRGPPRRMPLALPVEVRKWSKDMRSAGPICGLRDGRRVRRYAGRRRKRSRRAPCREASAGAGHQIY